MLMVSTDRVVTKTIREVKGLVTGSVVQSRHFGKDLFAGLKSIVGGELSSYTEMLEDSKRIVTERLEQRAKEIGANAIVGLRFEMSAGQGSSELIGYGTAVIVELRNSALYRAIEKILRNDSLFCGYWWKLKNVVCF
ncbi:hypothetical protein IKC_06409 [Bacillus cereus VD184]|uniref:UPF0145 protein IKC_06409 n=1 Tax=Bacillus cereus VD184 TaxID=1053242 RepID=A0A9W5R5B9_BACCE|nr:hypothetical protein IKC_06409 [Bacillus cereus VD184]